MIVHGGMERKIKTYQRQGTGTPTTGIENQWKIWFKIVRVALVMSL